MVADAMEETGTDAGGTVDVGVAGGPLVLAPPPPAPPVPGVEGTRFIGFDLMPARMDWPC